MVEIVLLASALMYDLFVDLLVVACAVVPFAILLLGAVFLAGKYHR